jgi:nucleotide-binding universal stress UspA family protein
LPPRVAAKRLRLRRRAAADFSPAAPGGPARYAGFSVALVLIGIPPRRRRERVAEEDAMRTGHLQSTTARSSERVFTEAAHVREILFPSDLTPASDRAFEHAALLAERFAARLTLYHLLHAPPAVSAEPRHPMLEALRRAERQAREHLERRVEGLSADWEIRVEQGESIHRSLLRTLLARRPDLTVLATHGREGIARLLRGSVAETVVNLARTPVLCVREPDHGVALPYRRILVPTDMSFGSARAFPAAALFARSFGADVIALHVSRTPSGDPPFHTSGLTYEMEAHAPSEQSLCSWLARDFQGVKLVPRVLSGSAAWHRILEVAGTERVDLIVMSTHGHDSLADAVIGSHTERVIRQAPCPVLVL